MGDLDAQIEPYFTSQVTQMQITVTTQDLCCYFRVLFPGSCKLQSTEVA